MALWGWGPSGGGVGLGPIGLWVLGLGPIGLWVWGWGLRSSIT